jgi:hypothetical protein
MVEKSDVVQHSKNKQHVKNMLAFTVDRQLITTTMKPSHEKDEVAAAEATLVYHGVRHRMSYLTHQCTTDVLKTLFVSSSIARSLSCAKIKATAIATEVLAPYFTDNVLKEIKSAHYFSLSFDASNKGSLKMYPFCVQYFSDVGVKKGNDVKFLPLIIYQNSFTVMIDFIDDSSESAVDIYRNARQIMEKYGLNLDGLTVIGADNANVNMGEHQCFLFIS